MSAFLAPDDTDVGDRRERYRRMLRIRRFEERVSVMYRDGEVPGFVHLSIGQEAVAVGATWSLRPGDFMSTNHRGHGHVLARGMDPRRALAELMAREDGICRGLGGSMHIADPTLGILGANGIVGAGIPHATGAALACKLRAEGQVALAFFGDGAVAPGAFHESIGLATAWGLPVVFCCENNHFSEFTPTFDSLRLASRAAGYGVPYHHVDGNDVEAVTETFGHVLQAVRAGGGPVLVEAETHRGRGHYEGDPQPYRTVEMDTGPAMRDPVEAAREALLALGLPEADLHQIDAAVDAEMREAEEAARRSAVPPPPTLYEHVYAPRPRVVEPLLPVDGEQTRVSRAIRSALEYELEHDPTVVVFGIDVALGGNVFGLTRGLHERWPDRVLDTPIAETAIVGAGVGAAMAGLRPVVEVMWVDFIGVCFDQIMNQAAKLRFMTGGAVEMPLVIRTQFGAGRSSGSHHSQSLEALLAHIPGLTVVMPNSLADTYGLLRAAIRDPNPVVFIENRRLYETKGLMPPPEHITPLGKAAVVRAGTDLTLVSWSRMVRECLTAAEALAAQGIEVEVIDLRTIQPLDRDTVLTSLAKTNRLLIAHEAVTDFGVGAELAAIAVDVGFGHLDGPVRRIGAPFTPPPYAPGLEQEWLPDAARIEAEVLSYLEVWR